MCIHLKGGISTWNEGVKIWTTEERKKKQWTKCLKNNENKFPRIKMEKTSGPNWKHPWRRETGPGGYCKQLGEVIPSLHKLFQKTEKEWMLSVLFYPVISTLKMR